MHILLELTTTQVAGMVVIIAILICVSGDYLQRNIKFGKRNLKVDFINQAEQLKGKISRASNNFLLTHYTKEIEALAESYWKQIPSSLLNDKIGDLHAAIGNRKSELFARAKSSELKY